LDNDAWAFLVYAPTLSRPQRTLQRRHWQTLGSGCDETSFALILFTDISVLMGTPLHVQYMPLVLPSDLFLVMMTL
jgi:hypothetical protein